VRCSGAQAGEGEGEVEGEGDGQRDGDDAVANVCNMLWDDDLMWRNVDR
jgi:hypothetical protein